MDPNKQPTILPTYFYKIEIKPEGYGVDAGVVSAFASKFAVGDTLIGKFNDSKFIFKSRNMNGELPADIVINGLNFIKIDGTLKTRAITGQTDKNATGAVKSKKRMRRTKRIKRTMRRRPHKRSVRHRL